MAQNQEIVRCTRANTISTNDTELEERLGHLYYPTPRQNVIYYQSHVFASKIYVPSNRFKWAHLCMHRKKKIGDASLWPIKLITYVGDFPLKIEAHYLAKKKTFAILINGYEYMTYQFTAMVGDSQDVM